jgi:outer membrane receptor protein involved in Fe transport
MKQKQFHLLILSLVLSLSGFSLYGQGERIEIRGKVIEQASKQAVMFATVILEDSRTDKVINGVTTSENGSFKLFSPTDSFRIKISFLGFSPRILENIKVQNGKAELGNIELSQNTQQLDEVEIRAERSQTEFKLDKRVFNVGQDLSSTGASALEVLNNVPSVNVNIEGEISLRGSNGVQVLINGKPSILASEEGNALGTITAEMIEKVEVITNPSAKYDAEGTSGIINIVMKKEEKKGMNGSISLNTGSPHNHSIGLSLNRRTEKFNLFSQFGAGYRELPRDNENINRDLNNNTTISSKGTEYRNEQFYNMTLGTDYHINRYNVLTLSGNFAYEIEDQPSLTNFSRIENNTVVSQWYRDESTEATNPKWQYELQYKKEFKENKEHNLLFSALGRFFGKDLSSEFENVSVFGAEAAGDQQTETEFSEANYTFKLDYTRPLSKKVTLESGGQYVITDVSNDYAVFNQSGGVWLQDDALTNVFDYDQKVFGVYSTGAYEEGKWGIKVGLRVENTDLNTLLATTGEKNQQYYTNLFPSFHSSYKLTERLSLQTGYSRRIFRPRLWDLNPFFNIRNNFSIRIGNPKLQPEFTDSYELTSIYILEKVSLNFGLYYRYTYDVIERVSTFENNVNTFKPMNIGSNRSTGLELNGKYTLSKKVSFIGDLNYNYFNRQGQFEGLSFDFTNDQWSAKLSAKFKLPAKIDFEATGNYRSGYQTVQSEVSANLFLDLGIRKKILNGKAVISGSVRDVFASRFRESETLQQDFYVYSYGRRGRFITLSFSYGFGKGEAMEYSGRRR